MMESNLMVIETTILKAGSVMALLLFLTCCHTQSHFIDIYKIKSQHA